MRYDRRRTARLDLNEENYRHRLRRAWEEDDRCFSCRKAVVLDLATLTERTGEPDRVAHPRCLAIAATGSRTRWNS